MNRPKRKLKRIFCEGDTEYKYFNSFRKLNENIEIKAVNMEGGGYREYLKK